VRTLRITVIVLLAVVSAQQGTRAQSLAFGLFERYLEPLRVQAGIPGLAAAIIQDHRIVWEGAFGFANLERAIRVQTDTPFAIVDLSQTFGATVLMQRIERGDLQLEDRMNRWTTLLPDPGTTVQNVLTHTTTGSYEYNPDRFSSLTPVIEYYTREAYRITVARDIFKHLAMTDSVPGLDLAQPSAAVRDLFDADDLERYQAVLARMAVPYRVDSRGRATRTEFSSRPIDAATGIVTTVRDLWRFDIALDEGLLLDRAVLNFMQGGAVPGTPTGHGWFVQSYNNERLVWHFGSAPGAYSSLILKVPGRSLTLILLANSDGLSEPFALRQGDVTASLFAKLFLRTFVS
jgi:CubicO group peptidase (beta-lactamase class C family)